MLRRVEVPLSLRMPPPIPAMEFLPPQLPPPEDRHQAEQALIRWEIPRLCRGGSKSLTSEGVHRRNSST
jgi:hypothetical protein